MFNILESAVKEKKIESISHKNINTTSTLAIIESRECRNFIEETLLWGGVESTCVFLDDIKHINGRLKNNKFDVIIIEKNSASNVINSIDEITNTLITDIPIIVIGREDSMLISRHFNLSGYHYLLWPSTKSEFMELITEANQFNLVSKHIGTRSKEIAIWGCKGGVGTSFLTAEIAYHIGKMTGSKSLVIDHDYSRGDLDFFFKKSMFEKKRMPNDIDADVVDTVYADNMIERICDELSLLSLTTEYSKEEELKKFVIKLKSLLRKKHSFIFEDFSNSGQHILDSHYEIKNYRFVLLVATPAVSCIRQLKQSIDLLNNHNSSVRQIIIINNTKPTAANILTKSEIEGILKVKVNVEVPFESKLNNVLIDGKYLSASKYPISHSISNICSLILGEQVKKRSFKDWVNNVMFNKL